MRKSSKIKKIKKKRNWKDLQKVKEQLDRKFPLTTTSYKEQVYIKPQRIKLPGDKRSRPLKHFSELTRVDKGGKESPFEIDEEKARNIFYSPPGKSPYTADFTRLKFWQSVLAVCNDKERRLLEYDLLDELKQRQIARKERISQSRVSQKDQKLRSKLQYHPYIGYLLMRIMGRKRFGKFMGKFIVEMGSGRNSKG